MAHLRVHNTFDGTMPKLSRAKRLVELCVYAWVEEGVSIRKLTLAESITARSEKARTDEIIANEQARLREPLPYAEIFGLSFEPPKSGEAAMKQEARLTWMASSFVKSAVAA